MISLRSEISRKLLNYFFLNPNQSLYVNELTRNLQVDKRNLVKKIKELEEEGVLKSQARGNLKLYSISQQYPLYDEYRKIIVKTLGFEDELRKILAETKKLNAAYIYGSYARDKMDVHSDIDLLIIGEHDIISLQRNLSRLQKVIGREINAVNMSVREFKKRNRNKDAFVASILKQKNIRII